MCILALFALIYNIINNISVYQMSKFSSSFGTLYEDIDLRTKWKTAFYLVYCLRRIFYVYIIFFKAHISGIQLVLMNLLNLAVLIYTAKYSALIGKLPNRLEISNEICVCFITFHMFYFTDWCLGYDIHSIDEKYLLPDVALLPDKKL